MSQQAFQFSSGTWASQYSLHPVVDDNQSALPANTYRWDIQNTSGTYEYYGTGWVLEFIPGTTQTNGTWNVSSAVWSAQATTIRNNHVIRVDHNGTDRGTFTETDAFSNGVMPTVPVFGQVGHVLTNTGHANNVTTSTWECISIANNEYLYRHGNISAYDFKYNVTNDQWLDANTTPGNWPSHFGTSTTDSTAITPTAASQYLYLYDSGQFIAEIENNGYSTSSGSGSGSGPNTLSGGSSPEIKDITFTKASDTIVYLAFNWQNVSTAYLFVDSGGTVSQTNISLGGLGQSGSVGSSGFLTNMQDGDKVWIANTDTVDDPYIHRYVKWSYNKSTGKVTAEAFFKDLGGNGFNQNADFALAEVFGITYNHGYSLAGAQADPTGGHVNHDGTLQTMSLSAKPGSHWAVSGLDTLQYGIGFKVPKSTKKVFSNFW